MSNLSVKVKSCRAVENFSKCDFATESKVYYDGDELKFELKTNEKSKVSFIKTFADSLILIPDPNNSFNCRLIAKKFVSTPNFPDYTFYAIINRDSNDTSPIYGTSVINQLNYAGNTYENRCPAMKCKISDEVRSKIKECNFEFFQKRKLTKLQVGSDKKIIINANPPGTGR